MRLHHLRLQAFGPFAGEERIDFDELATGGLHLIHGPTGAGKTSILDAICFALFAGVPGGRMHGRESLRSDHAAATARPEVELEFGVGERRFRVQRSPEHQVAKKRGTGSRAQRGSVTLQERTAGRWETISTRSDEVAEVIGDLLGMGLTQFAQVMLLPQGEFTAFLRAKPDDRGRLLERLFDISDFAAVERWLADHRKDLETQTIQASNTRSILIARAQELVSGVGPDVITGTAELPADPAQPAASGPVLDGIVNDLSDHLTKALAASDAAAGRAEQLRGRLADEQALAALQQQARSARATLDRIAEQAAQTAQARDRLAVAVRAQRCVPAIAAASRRRSVHEVASRATATEREQLTRSTSWAVPEPRDDVGLTDAALQPILERAAAGTVALAAHDELRRQQQSTETAQQRASEHLASARTEAEEHSAAATAVEAQVAQLTATRVGLLPEAAVRSDWVRLRDDLQRACHALDTARTEVDAAMSSGAHHRQAGHAWTVAERHVIQLRNRRLAGIAAELADGLTDGESCPVCGSPDHPLPAQPTTDHVDAEQLAAAEEAAKVVLAGANEAAARWSSAVGRARTACCTALDAVEQLVAVDQLVDGSADREQAAASELTELRAVLRETVGVSPASAQDMVTLLAAERPSVDPDLPATLTTLREAVADAGATAHRRAAETGSAERQLRVHETQLRAFEAELRSAQEAADTVAGAVRLSAAQVESLDGQAIAARDRIAEVLREHEQVCGCSAGADAVDLHTASAALLDRLAAAAIAQRTAWSELTAATDEVADALASAGFADAESATRATLSDAEAARLRALVSSAETDAAKATGVLEQPAVAAALDAPPATVDAVAEDVRAAERAARHTRDAVGEIRRALSGLQRITAELAAHDERTAPLAQELAVATSLASAVSGSGDNTMRMRLTAYVLAARLESVTALANERLQLMTDGRYQLEHTDERAARGSKSGLGLRVRDAWTGTTRDTGSLSGGESFIASLALALGLGDAVLEAAGGRRLETLLVDEGFGSLDEDSLEQVLDVLDGLRAGGRNVGIVSHVPELRTRIPAQIRVSKTARGSTVQVVTADVA